MAVETKHRSQLICCSFLENWYVCVPPTPNILLLSNCDDDYSDCVYKGWKDGISSLFPLLLSQECRFIQCSQQKATHSLQTKRSFLELSHYSHTAFFMILESASPIWPSFREDMRNKYISVLKIL